LQAEPAGQLSTDLLGYLQLVRSVGRRRGAAFRYRGIDMPGLALKSGYFL
jgi:hypothetical protein